MVATAPTAPLAAIDFTLAKTRHNRWRSQLLGYIDGQTRITEHEITSPHDCPFGRWIESTGRTHYASLPQMPRLILVHQQLHRRATDIVELVRTLQIDRAHEAFRQLRPLTDELMLLLDALEERVTRG